MKTSPLVFLDLDGVFRLMCDAANAGAYPPDLLACPGQPPSYFDFACVRRLNQLLDDTDAQFVIISTLRLVHPWPKLMRALQQAGIPLWRMHQDTGLPWSGDRNRDIMQWLARNQDVTNWCVLDDELRHYDNWIPHFKARVCGVCSRFGLQASTTLHAKELLLTP